MKTYLNGGREVEGVEREREREVSVEEECKLRNRNVLMNGKNPKECSQVEKNKSK